MSHMHQKLSKFDRISVRNNLVHQFYESDHVLDIAFTTVRARSIRVYTVRRFTPPFTKRIGASCSLCVGAVFDS